MPLKIPIHLRSQIRELIPLCCNHTDGHCLLPGGKCAQEQRSENSDKTNKALCKLQSADFLWWKKPPI